MKKNNRGTLSSIPLLGLGTWKSTRGEVGEAVSTALEIGYRHVDCASIYNNEKEIGAALASYIGGGELCRDDIWITSKLWNNAHAAKHVRPALERSLKNLQLDSLDLYLIHWPVAFKADITFPKRPDLFVSLEDLPIIETWRAMEKMVKKGLCRHIGVSNFSIPRLKELQSKATIQPLVNQVELHPLLQQPGMVDHCRDTGVHLTGYSPLGSAQRDKEPDCNLFLHPVIVALAEKYNATPAQILLAWNIHRGVSVIPKTTHRNRLVENYNALTLTLQADDMAAIKQLDRGHRFLDGAFFATAGSPYSVEDLWQD